jgi:hypothetical protein
VLELVLSNGTTRTFTTVTPTTFLDNEIWLPFVALGANTTVDAVQIGWE